MKTQMIKTSRKALSLGAIFGAITVITLSVVFANTSFASPDSSSKRNSQPIVTQTPATGSSGVQTSEPVSPSPAVSETPTPAATMDDEPFFEDKPRVHHTWSIKDDLLKGLTGSDGNTYQRGDEICASGDHHERCWNSKTGVFTDGYFDVAAPPTTDN